MFINCKKLTELICPFDTSKVTDMYSMFSMLSNLTSLDLSSFDTSKVKSMGYMFKDSYNLTRIKLGTKFAFVGTIYYLPKGTWYASDDTAYTSDGRSCTIPNNKADTYIRKQLYFSAEKPFFITRCQIAKTQGNGLRGQHFFELLKILFFNKNDIDHCPLGQ